MSNPPPFTIQGSLLVVGPTRVQLDHVFAWEADEPGQGVHLTSVEGARLFLNCPADPKAVAAWLAACDARALALRRAATASRAAQAAADKLEDPVARQQALARATADFAAAATANPEPPPPDLGVNARALVAALDAWRSVQ